MSTAIDTALATIQLTHRQWVFINKTAGQFVSTDEGRHVLTTLHLVSDGDKLRIEATDSYMLIRADTHHVMDDKFDVTVPWLWMQRVLRMAKYRSKSIPLELTVEPKQCIVRNGDEQFIVRHSQDAQVFPNFDNLITSNSVGIEPGAFDPKKLSVFSTALTHLDAPIKIEQLHALKPSQVRFQGDWSGVALLMPVRTDW